MYNCEQGAQPCRLAALGAAQSRVLGVESLFAMAPTPAWEITPAWQDAESLPAHTKS